MKHNISALLSLVIAVLLFVIFMQNSCNRENIPDNPFEVSIPAKEVVPTTKVVIKEVIDTFYVDRIKYVVKESKPDTELLNAYKVETDSLKKELLYAKAVTNRTYHTAFEDNFLKLDALAETTGILNRLSVLKYTIKEHSTMAAPPARSSLKFFVGGDVDIPLSYSTIFDISPKVYVENKGMLYSAGYSLRGKITAGLAIKL